MDQQSTQDTNNNNTSASNEKPPKKISTIADVLAVIKEQKPTIRNRFDAITIVLHLIMKELSGFRAVGTTDQIDSSGTFQ